MNLRWSLKELYPSFEGNEFKIDIDEMDKMIREFILWSNNSNDLKSTVQRLEEYISMQISFSKVFYRLAAFCHLTLSVDSRNEKAIRYLEIIEDKITALAEPNAKTKRWIGSIKDLELLIETSQILKEHSFYLKDIAEKSEFILSDKEEILIAKMKNSGSNAWSKLRDVLTSNLLVDIEIQGENKKMPLTVIRNMAYEKDASIRKKAYFAELEAYKKIEDSIAACLNGIKGEVITLDNTRGYSSPLEETLINSRLSPKALESMIQAIKESLPVFRRFYLKKAEMLGHTKGLPFYDIFAPVGEYNKKYSYEEAREFIVQNFTTFSDKLGNFAAKAFDNNWIDAEPREGKVGGAFCDNLFSIGESRIMANFSGNFNDVITLAHELGHGYHGECLRSESQLNNHYPMPIAETASTFCETLVKKAAIKNSPPEVAFAILENEISDSGQVIVDILSRYIFENTLFQNRRTCSLSVNEINEIMINAEKEAYGESLDENYLHPYMWICKPHYYSSEESYYNFPYAFGLLFAKGLYSMYLNQGEQFVDKYDKLLEMTGKNNISDIAFTLEIDISSIDFWRSSLKFVEEDIEEFIKLSNKYQV